MNYLALSTQIGLRTDEEAIAFCNELLPQPAGAIDRRTIKSVLIERQKYLPIMNLPDNPSAARRMAYIVMTDADYPRLDTSDQKVQAVLAGLQAEGVLDAGDVQAITELSSRPTPRHKVLGISDEPVTVADVAQARRILQTEATIAQARTSLGTLTAKHTGVIASLEAVRGELAVGARTDLPDLAAIIAEIA